MNAENKPESGLAVSAADAPAAARGRLRRRALAMIALPAALIVAGGWAYLSGGGAVATQDAYLHQALVPISANVAGRVTAIGFTDAQPVAEGALLFRVDPRPYRLALNQAEAALAQARLTVAQLKAAYGAAQTEVSVARDQVAYYNAELKRQQSLAARGAASIQALDSARHAAVVARGQLATAKEKLNSASAALGGDPSVPVDSQPAVQAARAARDKARFELAQTEVRAPAAGIVYKAGSFRVGEYVTPGVPNFTLVETQHVWIDANFKETQLAYVRPGQSARVSFDLYPGRSFAGRVVALGAGTGAEFSLIPPQNATGNWVKVAQRIPVHIELIDPPKDLPLHSGISASVTVETGHMRRLRDLLPF